MKRKYESPGYMVISIDIECCICNTSSTILIGNTNSDYQEEWEELPDDKRNIQW